jgi:hypothetical protein
MPPEFRRVFYTPTMGVEDCCLRLHAKDLLLEIGADLALLEGADEYAVRSSRARPGEVRRSTQHADNCLKLAGRRGHKAIKRRLTVSGSLQNTLCNSRLQAHH